MSNTTQKELECVNGYRLTTDWMVSGTAQWAYAEKNGKQWFIKKFLVPKYKIVGEGITEKAANKAKQRCELFGRRQRKYYDHIQKADTGNIVYIYDFFSFGTFFYAVSPRVEIADVSIKEISNLPHEKKMVLLKVLTHSLSSLHSQGVAHADLKPSNIILKRTASGNYTLKLIDFDAGFLEEDPNRGENIVFDPAYVAPETILALSDESIALTCKIDIFALGLLFHQYYIGEFPVLPEACSCAAEAVLSEKTPILNSNFPDWLKLLIGEMLLLDNTKRPTAHQVLQWLIEQKKPETPKPVKSYFRRPTL